MDDRRLELLTCFNPFCLKKMPPNKLCCDQHWKDLSPPLQNGLFLAWLDNDWELLQTLHR